MPRTPPPAKSSPKPSLNNLKKIRLARGENQLQFWARFGVTQSGGSRYETGRDIPVPTGALVMLWLTGAIEDAALAKAVKSAKIAK